ncbi:MAG: sigma 54-interacting transcriptional regulator [bacterium]|nr:sigma 54-interacting transcriptional regulator [bacterium]
MKRVFGYALETRTGATTERLGALGLTEGGTLFLEE